MCNRNICLTQFWIYLTINFTMRFIDIITNFLIYHKLFFLISVSHDPAKLTFFLEINRSTIKP